METERKTFAKSFSTTEQTQSQLADLREKFNLLNDSDTFRRCVADTHKREFPDYIYKKSAKDIESREKRRKQQQVESMDPIKFAVEHVPGCLILPGEDGHSYMVYHGMSNMLDAVRDDKIKDFVAGNPQLIEAHKMKVDSIPVISELNDYMIQYLQKYFGVTVPEDLLQNETNSLNTTTESEDIAGGH